MKLSPANSRQLYFADSLESLIDGEKDGYCKAPPTASYLTPEKSAKTNENYYVVNDGYIIIEKNTCIITTSRDLYLQEIYPKSWPLAHILTEDGETINVQDLPVNDTFANDTVVFPFMLRDLNHLFHSTMDNYARLAYCDHVSLQNLLYLFPKQDSSTPAGKALKSIFMDDINYKEIAAGIKYKVGKLVVPPLGNRNEYFCSRATKYVNHTINQKLNINKASHPTRLFISRADTPIRNLINEDEVIVALRQFGFTNLCPGEYSFQTQCELYANAEIVVAVHGNGLTPLVASSRCRHLIEFEAFGWGGTAYSAIAGGLGINYMPIKCEVMQSDIQGMFHWLGKADVSQLVNIVSSILD
ncbi:glycosyltransferase family 61 protein [Methylobacterium sp. 17Sr1-1]|uniref:glycosyltransferase family 61 protein n=1 Tax=Methylobacterium sp. 17Sr1-1 TaxID=2202826 RepID=UPI000D7031A2|nr:glycosyltransferase family 61 protein [Methylobacterium sp. 17Sr1-1]AWN55640.1 hypothetical protein DK412_14850 [Methylobacterium sp. 17Sr1-1]